MPNIIVFPSSHLKAMKSPSMRSSSVAQEAQQTERSFMAFRAHARQQIEDAIAGLERNFTRMRDCSRTLDDFEVKARLQVDLGLLEQQLEVAKSKVARLWPERARAP